jgi:hypothetical protein
VNLVAKSVFFVLLTIVLSEIVGSEESLNEKMESERQYVVDKVSEAYLEHVAHHLAVGGLAADLANDLAAASISSYSWCVMGPAIEESNKRLVSLHSVVVQILKVNWGIATSISDDGIDLEFLRRETATCENSLRESGGISN